MQTSIQTSSGLSQSAIHSEHVFHIHPHELAELQVLHQRLHRCLEGVRALEQSPFLSEDMRLRFTTGVPSHAQKQTDRRPMFLTTEIVLDRSRKPHVISVDAHSARLFESVMQLSKCVHGSFTRNTLLLHRLSKMIETRSMTMIRDKTGQIRYPHLCELLEGCGISVRHATMREACKSITAAWMHTDTPPVLFEHPMTQGGRKERAYLSQHAKTIISPHVALSSPHILSILSNPENDEEIARQLGTVISSDDLRNMRSAIAPTYSIHPGMRVQSIPPCVIKRAHPLDTHTVQAYVSDMECVIPLMKQPYVFVAQQCIEPFRKRIKGTGDYMHICKTRLVFISYGGELLTGACIAQVPDNGQPKHNVGLSLYVA